MSNIKIKRGEILTNKELCEIFKCSPQGGMRKSNTTNTLVLISDQVDSLYEDEWMNNVLHYTGMGQHGDQDINKSQNKTLLESNSSGVEVHLMEVFKKGEYTYQGRVFLGEDPYEGSQPDARGIERKVYIFPLHLDNKQKPVPVEYELMEEKKDRQERKTKAISDEELADRIEHISSEVGQRIATSKVYQRDPLIVEYTKRRASGICELCKNSAPFKKKDSTPYLETHHITWLSKGGKDSIQNTVALCPNCHRKMHILNKEEDIESLQNISK